MAVLTRDDVDEIRQFLEDGLLQREVAEMYGVSASNIGKIKRGEIWT
jgi:Trp operon repressor